ncbi:hypothetical protein [Methanoculleus sp. 10]|uniref:hypothetical protein n=1 Tax=Methanoculleus sp. 10 TaxID=430615 RepID=UPI0034366280
MTDFTDDPLYRHLTQQTGGHPVPDLVEIAEHQPAVRQQEIAGKLGVTPQAVSEPSGNWWMRAGHRSRPGPV